MSAVSIAEVQQPMADQMMVQSHTTMLLMNPVAMEQIYRFSEMMASGKTAVPAHLRGNVADCMAITMQAMQWKLNPFAVMQKTHVINGVLGYEAQLVAAVINSSGVVVDRFHFEWFGPWQNVVGKFTIKTGDKGEYRVPGWKLADEAGCGVRVWATIRGESEPRLLELLLAQARTRNSTLWADDPKQQLAYLAQKRWARLYAPDVILGVYSPDELQERDIEPRDINPAPESAATAAQPQQRTSGLSSSLKARSAANQPVTVEPVAELVAGDDDALIIDDEPALSPEAQKYEAMLMDCTEAEHFADWQGQVKAKFAANSHDYIALVKSYKARRAQFSNAN
ncbi:RecT family recombinase [Rheinheimera tilapiae]|uniref:RecT family recombinase n=1 Tax=Rheinheimera tilapiae TaxID=875043 RepID=A0ABV6BA64_9GAMM